MMTVTETATQPDVRLLDCGFHPGLPEDDYHRLAFASASFLNAMRRSPAHARERMLHPQEPTPDMRFGTAVHLAVLQPAAFRQAYAVADQCKGQTDRGKRCSRMGSVRFEGVDWYCSQHAGELPPEAVEVLAPDDFDRCLAVAEAVNAHPMASAILGQRTETELSAVWLDELTGVRCKCRADAVCGNQATIADLKTTSDASRAAFERSIVGFGYHVQCAHYLSGFNALGMVFRDFVFIAVEKVAPFAVAVYRLKDDVVEAGKAERNVLLAKWSVCEQRGEWPAYAADIQDISLPSWAWREIERIG